jgi:hypothetical protein
MSIYIIYSFSHFSVLLTPDIIIIPYLLCYAAGNSEYPGWTDNGTATAMCFRELYGYLQQMQGRNIVINITPCTLCYSKCEVEYELWLKLVTGYR